MSMYPRSAAREATGVCSIKTKVLLCNSGHKSTEQNTKVHLAVFLAIAITLGLGVGPGEALKVLLMAHEPFLLVELGVVQPWPVASGSADRCLEAVCSKPVGLPRVDLEDASEMALSSGSSLTCAGL